MSQHDKLSDYLKAATLYSASLRIFADAIDRQAGADSIRMMDGRGSADDIVFDSFEATERLAADYEAAFSRADKSHGGYGGRR